MDALFNHSINPYYEFEFDRRQEFALNAFPSEFNGIQYLKIEKYPSVYEKALLSVAEGLIRLGGFIKKNMRFEMQVVIRN